MHSKYIIKTHIFFIINGFLQYPTIYYNFLINESKYNSGRFEGLKLSEILDVSRESGRVEMSAAEEL